MSSSPPFQLARRADRIQPSIIREILNLAARPGVISLAGGLPSPDAFPLDAVREATQQVLQQTPREALQYASTEGFAPLREWVAQNLASQGLRVNAGDVLVTSGSQQGLDLVGKVLLDPGTQHLLRSRSGVGRLWP